MVKTLKTHELSVIKETLDDYIDSRTHVSFSDRFRSFRRNFGSNAKKFLPFVFLIPASYFVLNFGGKFLDWREDIKNYSEAYKYVSSISSAASNSFRNDLPFHVTYEQLDVPIELIQRSSEIYLQDDAKESLDLITSQRDTILSGNLESVVSSLNVIESDLDSLSKDDLDDLGIMGLFLGLIGMAVLDIGYAVSRISNIRVDNPYKDLNSLRRQFNKKRNTLVSKLKSNSEFVQSSLNIITGLENAYVSDENLLNFLDSFTSNLKTEHAELYHAVSKKPELFFDNFFNVCKNYVGVKNSAPEFVDKYLSMLNLGWDADELEDQLEMLSCNDELSLVQRCLKKYNFSESTFRAVDRFNDKSFSDERLKSYLITKALREDDASQVLKFSNSYYLSDYIYGFVRSKSKSYSEYANLLSIFADIASARYEDDSLGSQSIELSRNERKFNSYFNSLINVYEKNTEFAYHWVRNGLVDQGNPYDVKRLYMAGIIPTEFLNEELSKSQDKIETIKTWSSILQNSEFDTRDELLINLSYTNYVAHFIRTRRNEYDSLMDFHLYSSKLEFDRGDD